MFSISTLHQKKQKFDVPIEATAANMVVFCHLKSEDFGIVNDLQRI